MNYLSKLLQGNISRRDFVKQATAAGVFVATSGLWVPRAYGSDNIRLIEISGSKGEMTGNNVMRYLNGVVKGQLEENGFYDDVANYMRLQKGKTLEKILITSQKGRNAQLHTHLKWDDGSKVDLTEYQKKHPDKKAILVDRVAIGSKPQSLDYAFAGDTWVLNLDKMLKSNKPGVTETAKKLMQKYPDREINVTPAMMDQWAGSDSSVQKMVNTYVDAVEAVYGAGHAAAKELKQLLKDNPAAVMGKMVTPELGKKGGMYHALTQGEGAIKITDVVAAAEAGKTVRTDKSYAPALAHRVDLSKPAIFWGISYGIINPVTGELKKDKTYGVFEKTKIHHVVNERGADMGELLGDPTYQAILATRTYDKRILAHYGSDNVGNSRDARKNHMMVWTQDKELYKKLVNSSATIGEDLATITNSIRPSWIDGPTSVLHYMAFQGVKAKPKG